MLFFFMVGLTNYWGTYCPNYTPYFNLIVQYWILAISWLNGLDLYYYVYNNIFILLFFIFVQGPCVCIYIYIYIYKLFFNMVKDMGHMKKVNMAHILDPYGKIFLQICYCCSHMEKYSYTFVIVLRIYFLWKTLF